MSLSVPGCRWRRVGARVLDYVVSCLPALPLMWLAVPFLERSIAMQVNRVTRRTLGSGGDTGEMREAAAASLTALGQTASVVVLALFVVTTAVLCFYDWVCHAAFGRTLGKLCFGVRVVHAGHGGRPGVVRSFLRTGVLFGLPLFFGTWLAVDSLAGGTEPALVPQLVANAPVYGLLLALLPAQRALHDFVSGTEVTRA
ncbi:RDD family protein [Streptomyces uncialis]|uniref:RDD family protein n=1 Tax=Streptomyces uncialis TaxID=1048205 RepID=UPI00380158D3